MRAKTLLAAMLFLCACGLRAADDSDAWAKYNHLKDDADSYVGEGVAKLDEFGGDTDKAMAAARQRATADLASAIRVHVSSSSSESIKSDKAGTSEELSSKSEASSDLNIENVKQREFSDFPSKGKITVLAYVSKEDYRRQLAGKGVKIYSPELGFRIGGGLSLPDTDDLHQDQQHHPGGDPAGLELDFIWRSFYFGYQVQFDQAGVSDQLQSQKSYSIHALNLGYDWAPWAWRVQPFVPLQIQYAYWDMDPSFAQTFEAGAGLGLRFWPNDTIAFQLQGMWKQGLWGGAIYQSGGNFVTVNGHDAHVAMTGPAFSAGIMWSGF